MKGAPLLGSQLPCPDDDDDDDDEFTPTKHLTLTPPPHHSSQPMMNLCMNRPSTRRHALVGARHAGGPGGGDLTAAWRLGHGGRARHMRAAAAVSGSGAPADHAHFANGALERDRRHGYRLRRQCDG